MDLAPELAELGLEERMHVLVLARRDRGMLELAEPLLDLGQLLGRQEARSVQALRVYERRAAVVRQELGVVAAQELAHLGHEPGSDTARPECHSGL
jgi:hypothetical protein